MQEDQKIRICMISNRFHPIVGGTERQALMLSHGLIEKGHAPFILTRRLSRELSHSDEISKVPVRRLGPVGQNRIADYMAALNCFVFLVIHGRRFDILHAHNVQHITLAAILAARIVNRPILCKIPSAGDISRQVKPFLKLPWYVKIARVVFFMQRWRPFLLQKAAAVIAPSKGIEDELDEYGLANRRIRIPNGINTQRFHSVHNFEQEDIRTRLRLPSNNPIVISVGRLVSGKGIDRLLQAWPKVLVRIPNALLLIAGSGDFQLDSIEKELRTFSAEMNLSENVRFLGNVSNVEHYLQAADLFAFPSLGEGMPNAVLEAMATGLPIVASNVGGITDLITHNQTGHLFDVDNQDQIAESICAVLMNPAYAKQLGTAALKLIEDQYTIDIILQKYIKLYSHILQGKSVSQIQVLDEYQ